MFFKNLRLYRFSKPVELTAEQLNDALDGHRFSPCQPQQPESWGFSAPLGGDHETLVHEANGKLIVCVKREQKIMPAAAVNEVLAARVEEIEARDGDKISRKQRNLMKDEIVLEMLPRAFTRSSRHFAYLDMQDGWLIADASAATLAEQIIGMLREALGSMPVKPLTSKAPPPLLYTEWLKAGQIAADLLIEDECELREPDESGGVVRVRKHDLAGDEIRVHLDAGKHVTKLAVSFDERVAFVLDDQLAIKRLKFLDAVLDELDDMDIETPEQRFDTDFAIMSLELSRLLARLVEIVGVEGAGDSTASSDTAKA